MASDEFRLRYSDLVTGGYDCVDRIVLNAFFPLGLLALRYQVIAPILAGIRSPKMGRKPAHGTRVDRDYERIRIETQALFNDLAIQTPLAA